MKKPYILLLFFLISLAGFILPGKINAEEGGGGGVVCPPPPTCPDSNVWDEYTCSSICGISNDTGADIKTRRVFEWYTLESASGVDCPSYSCKYNIREGDWSKSSSCQPWQACGPGGISRKSAYGPKNYNDTLPSCSCSAGQCLEAPKDPRYYDSPDYSDQADKDMGSASVLLPVKFDWNDVVGWLKAPDGPKSYLFQLNTEGGAVPEILTKSEYSGLREEKGACFLKSNTDYSWQAQACCSVDGKNCGPASAWSFKTGMAPELVSPEDPDWAGPKGGAAVITPDSPLKIDWCDIKEAKSYRFRVFLEEGGKRICSPVLFNASQGEQCDSWVIRKERRDPNQIEKLLYSDFTDSGLNFFTKDTIYDWEVKICLDEDGGLSGGECKDYSQRWSFTSEQKSFKDISLVSPQNDPEGKNPIGFPFALSWSSPPGMNSFVYQINNWAPTIVQGTQSDILDVDILKLNTIYKWKVRACSDFVGSKCENFSQEWSFKTTGQPPILENPAPGSSSVPIPINLKWQEVSGAKSYILKISGDGLNLEKTVDKPEFSIAYPEYNVRQEADYNWQVKTCAHDGWACGQYGPAQTFTTFRLPIPSDPSPENGGQLQTDQNYVSWNENSGVKTYQYKIRYLTLSSDEVNESCKLLAGQEIVSPQIIHTNSAFIKLDCLGNYQWQVRSCLDENCVEASNWSGSWNFNLTEPTGASKGGLIPCGKNTDNPKTPWNEREPCQVKHVFLMVKIIFDFLLLRMVPVILVLLTIYSGLMFYFSLGKAATLAGVISLWKSAGIGMAIIAIAWTLVNIFLKLIGYQVGIFGNWYSI
ncbi:MAG: hypothetical protein HYT20_00130 [Candidatus Nealsonbacteria bacterium]|nr:hypothetical protein [Candidatus Nealsonbacteria bacterium]